MLAIPEFTCHRPRQRRTPFFCTTAFPSTPYASTFVMSCVTSSTVKTGFHHHRALVTRTSSISQLFVRMLLPLSHHISHLLFSPHIWMWEMTLSTPVNVRAAPVACLAIFMALLRNCDIRGHIFNYCRRQQRKQHFSGPRDRSLELKRSRDSTFHSRSRNNCRQDYNKGNDCANVDNNSDNPRTSRRQSPSRAQAVLKVPGAHLNLSLPFKRETYNHGPRRSDCQHVNSKESSTATHEQDHGTLG